ncbi:MAG: hypothetical protein U9Q67_02205 [Patescibacteria group bacterium]|nr:hypothetical protein [Patescibacteria group bacterium]
MEEIPAAYWMIIITGLSGMLGLIMYYMAMLLKESMKSVRELRYMIVETHDILDAAKVAVEKSSRIVDMVSTTVETVSDSILRPIAGISTFLLTIKSFLSNFVGVGEENGAEQ